MGCHHHVRICCNGVKIRSVGTWNKEILDEIQKNFLASIRHIPQEYRKTCKYLTFIFVKRHNSCRDNRTIERIVVIDFIRKRMITTWINTQINCIKEKEKYENLSKIAPSDISIK